MNIVFANYLLSHSSCFYFIQLILPFCICAIDDPLVVSVLNGNALRIVLDDEDDFAMLAENLFTDLDADDNGKLSKNDISNALLRMGVQLGVPPIRGWSCCLCI